MHPEQALTPNRPKHPAHTFSDSLCVCEMADKPIVASMRAQIESHVKRTKREMNVLRSCVIISNCVSPPCICSTCGVRLCAPSIVFRSVPAYTGMSGTSDSQVPMPRAMFTTALPLGSRLGALVAAGSMITASEYAASPLVAAEATWFRRAPNLLTISAKKRGAV